MTSMPHSPSLLFVTEADANHASSRVRALQYGPALAGLGFRTRAVAMWPTAALGHPRYRPRRAWAGMMRPVNIARAVILARRVDLVFIHLALPPVWAQRLLFAANPRVVFDFVDPIFISSRRPSHTETARERRLVHMLRHARAVLVENDTMAEYARRYNAVAVRTPTPVDTDRFVPGPSRARGPETVIGWIGTPSTTPYLAEAREGLRHALAAHPRARVELIGAAARPLDDLPAVRRPWSLATEVADLQRCDIGIMPLPDNEWTRGKGGYKLLQYMAVGLPCVASPVGINREIVEDGINGFLASTDDEWRAALGTLLADPDLRRRMGESGRARVEARYSLRAALPRVSAILHGVADAAPADTAAASVATGRG
jgi:glycosyltransferase involved in cell wall biosynthesis